MLGHQRTQRGGEQGQAGPQAGQAGPGRSNPAGNAAQQDRLMAGGVGGAQDAQEAQADGVADAVMRRVRGYRQGPEQAKPAKAPARGISPDLARAFEEELGFDVTAVPLVTGGAAAELAQRLSATAFAAQGAAFLPGDSAQAMDFDSMWLVAHELAHVALGHAAGGPARRQADTSDLRLGYLTRGDTGKAVERLQDALVTLGHLSAQARNTGPGVYGPRTEAAVRAFQAAARITVDGEAGPQTEAALEAALARGSASSGGSGGSGGSGQSGQSGGLTGSPPLTQGDSGKAVETLQKRLNHYGASLMADGEFGPRTRQAVIAFQKANGIAANGEVGTATAAALSGDTAKRFTMTENRTEDSGAEDNTPSDPNLVNIGDADPKGILSSSKLNPTVKEKARKVLEGLQAKGLKPYLFEGHRTMERQNDLYAQGRTKGGSIVTYVRGGGSWHNYGLAVDIVFWDSKHKGPSWGGPHSQWTEVGKQATKAGFTRWLGTIGDYPHMEYHPKWGNDCSSLLSTYNSGGFESVWKKIE